ncbi:MAG: glycosyltransferase family 4 protein [Myxococcota bacterium]|nr:glycosyltransferase family 4 protein [Myxococcota bacterium]
MGSRRNIAMILPGPFPTRQGTQVLVRHLATALAEAGHAVHLVTYGYGEYEDNFPFMVHRAQRVDVGFRSGPSLLKPAADAALLLTAGRVIKAYGCEVVHVHNVEGIGIGAMLKLQFGLPLIYHSHNSMGLELPTYYKRGAVRAFAGLLGEVVDRTLPRAADRVIVFDEAHAEQHARHGVARDRSVVIPPGIAAGELAPSLKAPRSLGRRLLYAGNPDGYQNLGLLYEALKRVRRLKPDVRLLIASHHPLEAFLPELKSHGVDRAIEHIDCQSLADIVRAHAMADIGVCPRSIWTGFPIKVLNYLAAGLPVVGCRGAVGSVVDTSNGVLADPNPDAWATAIEHAFDRLRHWHDLGVGDAWRIENQVALYERLYREVLLAATGGRSRQRSVDPV